MREPTRTLLHTLILCAHFLRIALIHCADVETKDKCSSRLALLGGGGCIHATGNRMKIRAEISDVGWGRSGPCVSTK